MESQEAIEPVWPGPCLSSDWAEMPTQCEARARLATPQPGHAALLSQWNSPPRTAGRLLSSAGYTLHSTPHNTTLTLSQLSSNKYIKIILYLHKSNTVSDYKL